MAKLILPTLFFLFLFGCTTTGPGGRRGSAPGTQSSTVPSEAPFSQQAEYDKLQSDLGLTRDAEDLGYAQSAFNDCRLPPSMRLSNVCRTQYMTIIHFRLQCRGSTGTVDQVTVAELRDLQSSYVKWHLGNHSGSTTTNYRGFGKIRLVTPNSVDQDKFRLQVKNEILGVTAKEAGRFVLPQNWCQ